MLLNVIAESPLLCTDWTSKANCSTWNTFKIEISWGLHQIEPNPIPTFKTKRMIIICSDTELFRVVWISFHSLATKYILQTLTTSPVDGRGCSQSIMKTPMLHCSYTIHNTPTAYWIVLIIIHFAFWKTTDIVCIIHFQDEGADDQLFDEMFVSSMGQTDDNLFLLSECHQPVEGSEEDHQWNNVGHDVTGIDNETHQSHQINSSFSRP